ncbi:hypothetical protein IWX48DRAFT_597761, partial [Phyllosticta citricarpa]
ASLVCCWFLLPVLIPSLIVRPRLLSCHCHCHCHCQSRPSLLSGHEVSDPIQISTSAIQFCPVAFTARRAAESAHNMLSRSSLRSQSPTVAHRIASHHCAF